MKQALLKALKHQQLITIMYMAKDGTITKRRVKLFAMNQATFQAYCFTRGAKRTFSIDRVLAVVPVVKYERRVI